MSKFMVAGFVQMETIIKVEALPVPYKQFESIPDLVNSGIGGAIRHLVDHGYTVDRIIKEFHYPISRESIEKTVNQYLEEKSK